jgi:hypothetical protein
VTHWSIAEVEEEKATLSRPDVSPTIVVERFDQILGEFKLELSNEEADVR